MLGNEKDIERGCQIANRLKKELEIAQSSWAHFEAINGETERTRQQFRNAKAWLGFSVPLQNLLEATIRDTVLALCRILDDPKKDRFTLAEVSKLLDSKELREALTKHAHIRMPRFEGGASLQEIERQTVGKQIKHIREYIPKQWGSRPEKKWMLYKIREETLRNLRHKVLAHAGEAISIDTPTVNQLRYAIGRTDTLVSATHHIFVGSPLDNKSLNKFENEANKFWDYAEVGFIEAFERDQRNIRSFNG